MIRYDLTADKEKSLSESTILNLNLLSDKFKNQ